MVASAISGAPIVCMKIYFDSVAVYSANNVSQIDTYIKASKGSHLLVVQAWDSSGTVHKTTVSITVK